MNKQMKNNDGEDSFGAEPFYMTAKPLAVEYTVNIDEEFHHTKQFQFLVQALEHASAADSFVINLTTPGGSLQAVLPLLGAMKNTEAHTHVHVCSDVASAGTLVLLAADSVSLNDYVEIMFHQVKFGAVGEGWNVERQVEHTLKSAKRLMRESYEHFLTEEEISRMLTGTPFYMDKEEFVERYQKRSEALEAEMDAVIAEMEAIEAEASAPKKVKKSKKAVDTVPEL